MIKVKYFGMLADRLDKHSDELSLENESFPLDLNAFFCQRHPELNALTFKVAVNHEILTHLNSKERVHEIALLPPFAGG